MVHAASSVLHALAATVPGALRNHRIVMVSVSELNALGIWSRRQGTARRCCCCCHVTRHIFTVISSGPVAHVEAHLLERLDT